MIKVILTSVRITHRPINQSKKIRVDICALRTDGFEKGANTIQWSKAAFKNWCKEN